MFTKPDKFVENLRKMNRYIITMISLAALASSTCRSAQTDAVSFPEVKDWNLTVLPDVYTPGNLWDLINGAAESYLSYNFVDLHLGCILGEAFGKAQDWRFRSQYGGAVDDPDFSTQQVAAEIV